MGQSENQAPASPVNVHLLTENRLLRESLARLLQKRAGICVVAVSDCMDRAVEEIAASQCDILLTDCLTTERGADLLGALFEGLPQVRVVLFGMAEDFGSFLKSASLGVGGYVLKDASASELVAAVRGVARDEAVCPPKLCMGLIQHLAKQYRARPKRTDDEGLNKPALTHRQLELVGLVARGLSNKEIASTLNLSEFTVKNHIRRILKQVDADDRYEAVDAVRAIGYLPTA